MKKFLYLILTYTLILSFFNIGGWLLLPSNLWAEQDIVAPTTDFSRAEGHELFPGGETTHFKAIDRNAFSYPSQNMSFEKQLDFKIGNGIFKKIWVSSPSSTESSDGLGPLFNAKSCQHCHLKDGRGHPPSGNWPDDSAVSMFLRLSIPPQNAYDHALIAEHKASIIPDPIYGGQLQDFAIQGIEAEGKMHIIYDGYPVTFDNGDIITLRKPYYQITDLHYGPMHPQIMISPRVTPQMIGLGLLEAISEEDILALSDPGDSNHDGISGRPNIVWDDLLNKPSLGRFGWKAGQPTLYQQSAGAFHGDIGLSNPLHLSPYGDCMPGQTNCIKAPHGNTPSQDNLEVSSKMMDMLVFYTRNLAVPARRDIDNPDVLKGKEIFYQAGCTSCHKPKFKTRCDTQFGEQSCQLIWPYTDLLLHDMGEGLADDRPEGEASGREWRTPPLWGIGATQAVSDHTYFLHDGRARNLMEAILWHEGEASASKEKILKLSPEERQQLLLFLESL